MKDMGIALEECERMDLDLPGLSLARSLYQEVVATGGAQLGTQALYSVVDRLSGIQGGQDGQLG